MNRSPCYMCWIELGEAAANTPEARSPDHQKRHALELVASYPPAYYPPDSDSEPVTPDHRTAA